MYRGSLYNTFIQPHYDEEYNQQMYEYYMSEYYQAKDSHAGHFTTTFGDINNKYPPSKGK